jgi:hypothetical protein
VLVHPRSKQILSSWNLHSSGSCVTCPVGTYTLDKANATSCTSCPVGKFNSLVGASFCLDCPLRFYGNSTGATSCVECPKGSYTNSTGQISISQCKIQTCIGWSTFTASGMNFFFETSLKSDGQRVFRSNFRCGQLWHGGNLYVTTSASVLSNTNASSTNDIYIGAFKLGTSNVFSLDPDLPSTSLNPPGSSNAISCLVYNVASGSTSPNDCKMCPPGFFQNAMGQSSCYPCAIFSQYIWNNILQFVLKWAMPRPS